MSDELNVLIGLLLAVLYWGVWMGKAMASGELTFKQKLWLVFYMLGFGFTGVMIYRAYRVLGGKFNF